MGGLGGEKWCNYTINSKMKEKKRGLWEWTLITFNIYMYEAIKE